MRLLCLCFVRYSFQSQKFFVISFVEYAEGGFLHKWLLYLFLQKNYETKIYVAE